MFRVVDVGQPLQQAGRQLAHGAHEAVVAIGRRQVAEERRGEPGILGQHGPYDDAPAAQPGHVDHVGGIAMDLVAHGTLAQAALSCRGASGCQCAVWLSIQFHVPATGGFAATTR